MRKNFTAIAAACLLTFGAFAQNAPGRNSGTTTDNDELISDPSMQFRMEQIELSCGTPTSLSVSNISHNGADFYWSPVVGATRYKFQYRIKGTTTWTTVILKGSDYFYFASGVFNSSTIYEYRVRTVCSGVNSAFTAIYKFTTIAPPNCAGVPASVTVNVQQTSVAINWLAVAGATNYRVEYRVLNSVTFWTTVNATILPIVITPLTSNTVYEYRVRSTCSFQNGPWSSIRTFTTLSPGGGSCTGIDNYEPNNTKATATPLATNFNAYPLISSSTDKDWLSFTTTTAAPKIKVTMDNLPGDYDLILYGAAGTQITTSRGSGTTNEQIIYNASTGSSYKIEIYGSSGAFNASLCYRVRVSTSATAFREENTLNTSDKSTVSIFPNPSQGNLTITLESDNDQSTTINIVDLTGRNVMQLVKDVTDGTNTIDVDLHGLSDGIYFVKVNTNGDISSHKIIVKK